MYCCIPECGNSQYDRNMNKTNIALFSFPTKENKTAVYKSWCNEIHKFRRKGGKDGLTITKSTEACELHFKPDDRSYQISRYLITWSNFLYLKLGCIPIWPSKDECIASMPHMFKETYPSTRVSIDCTELFCQGPSSLTIQSSLFFHYKYDVTYKGLVGIAPSGGITFISELYDGSISDVEIVQRCGILKKDLWDESDSLMADRGFNIENLLKPLGVSLNIPALLHGREQLTNEEVTES